MKSEAGGTLVEWDENKNQQNIKKHGISFQIARSRRNKQVKPVVALRISQSTLDKAKATGKGYTGFLSRLLDNAINDPKIVAKSM